MKRNENNIGARRRQSRRTPALYEAGFVCAVAWLVWRLIHTL